ncbi:MAG TPA: sigma-54 factor interaction domain-containing protein, partial [Bryobacteraceae bacterium]|nr:sigma-54 factor interaction domain-containing protein [Bryobacteraceae bacterium]
MQRDTYPVNDAATSGESSSCSFLGMTAIIGSTPMRQLMRAVERIAKSNAAVLITGETGSGKEVVARAVHHHSLRSTRPWVDVNCAALPDHLLESELFGFERGAFSGADSMKQGLFEVGHTGTLFLDEIGDLDLKLQVKLLRVLDGTPYYRLGGTRKVSVDVRIVAATNLDLREAVGKGTFRRDLYHRLDQARMEVPPL